jgi:precorrin-2 dehydrogenase/sirohydrochlorin ferrochelatase
LKSFEGKIHLIASGFNPMIPEDINKMVENLNEYRKTLKGNFEEKVQKMNEITEGLKNKE